MKIRILSFLLLITTNVFSQNNLKNLLKMYNTESIPYISVNQLQKTAANLILLDVREKKEFKTSHLKNAKFVGYTTFNLKETLKKIPNKKSKIVVYCSLGIRSEDIAEKLKVAGYTNVLNLYGGIFEWKNKGNLVFDSNGNATEKIHVFSKEWSKWLLKGKKVYE
ncbi:rhodanese-like domain-containing protein [Polaribacter sp.]|nr:rhodanese-like domain-containing protein [Polaribacter sp.]MDC1353593.1 rhodanese-like domain-containing protein [Polaribacter sp.]